MKKAKIIFWITTIIIFLFEGVMPALTSQSEMAKEESNIWVILSISGMLWWYSKSWAF